VTFVASRCNDACPIANAEFARLAQQLRRDRVALRLLTITMDPAYDTPFVMAGIARQYRADPARWQFCSGPPSEVRRVMAAFGVVTERGRDGVPDVHSTFVYVLDEHGRVAQKLLLSTTLPDDAERALKEGRRS